ncbi:MAG: DUF305 domain-containing protein [Anaerolineae bacterium]|nr:DUF305 domain-containing protein [Anaerolineae bacterium]
MKRLIFTTLLATIALFAFSFAAADAPVEGRAGRAEVRFLEGMIDHHQMALDMAADCLERASTEDVRSICEAVIAAQTPEIELMQGWLAEWYNIDYQPMPMADMGMDMGMHAGMDMGGKDTDPAGMMGMMAGLNRAEGLDYDLAWLESMIDHHDDALHMSERILNRAEHAELRTLAETIITAQSAEIEQMEALLGTLVSQ